jgi:hypothetical protein
MRVEPTGSATVEMVATIPFSATVPNVVAPALNVTVPVACAPVEDVTVAVNVTVWSCVEGLAEDVIAVVVEAGFTACSKAEDVLGAESLSPLYSAVMAYVPALSQVLVILATPPLKVAVPWPTK